MVAEMQDVYVANGYENRIDYFKHLSAEYGVDFSIVALCAELMGESEDFDGLPNMLEDAAETAEWLDWEEVL